MIIKVFANFREICGGKVIELTVEEGQSISTVLDELINQFPKMYDELYTVDKQLKPLVHVFVNGRNIIHLEGLTTTIHSSDQIALFPPVAGG
ncbi:molybdopterin synthase sulfur carrier subunit [Anaerobacillus alkalilacustris]|uniref:Molybdopterin synthase sulfur carrier subunit n=1 Tax=Anaerobacillus alkalilacustris TaxID=393763 RepID=A0A1S2LEG9_9BACI|nr:ubiquitin-like small modifier protein 1 [Anaerobacillus alkalilacustris]OIJ10756.1 molybdopterin synthase sulfur carrier subunit [Anaerobacillus alkalilacustris]